jgi:hypothetical protein
MTLSIIAFLMEVSMKRWRGGVILLARFFRREAAAYGRRAGLDGEGEGRCSAGFGGEVSGSGFESSVFDIWAMLDDGPPKMSSAKDDFASRNEVI